MPRRRNTRPDSAQDDPVLTGRWNGLKSRWCLAIADTALLRSRDQCDVVHARRARLRLLRLAMEQHLGQVVTAINAIVEPLVTTGSERIGIAETCSFGCSLAISAKNAD